MIEFDKIAQQEEGLEHDLQLFESRMESYETSSASAGTSAYDNKRGAKNSNNMVGQGDMIEQEDGQRDDKYGLEQFQSDDEQDT